MYPALEDGRIPEGTGPTAVVRARPRVGGKTGQDQAILLYRGDGLTARHKFPLTPGGIWGVMPQNAWRGTGPRPTGRGGVFFTASRGPVPRDVERFMKHPHLICTPAGSMPSRRALPCSRQQYLSNRFESALQRKVRRQRIRQRNVPTDKHGIL